MSDPKTSSTARRDTGWRRDGKSAGIYWQARAKGKKAWGYYDPRLGRVVSGCRTRQEAIDKRAKAQLDKSAGLPVPDTRVRIRDLAEELRDTKRRRPAALVVPCVGGRAGSDRPQRDRPPQAGAAGAGSDRQADPRPRGARTQPRHHRQVSPAAQRNPRARGEARDHRLEPNGTPVPRRAPTGGKQRKRFEWSPEAISKLIAAADDLGKRSEARLNYAPLIQLLALTGLRVSEALALRWGDVDLLEGLLSVRHSLGRDGALGEPKTKAGERDVPLRPGLVDLLLQLKPLKASDEDFVFAGKSGKPLGYWNVRNRGFQKAVEKAGLDGNDLTIHDLRHAAASLYIASGLTPVDVAAVLGHANASITLKVYAHLFDRSDVQARIRAAQETVTLPGEADGAASSV
jgi:integrase